MFIAKQVDFNIIKHMDTENSKYNAYDIFKRPKMRN